MIATKTFIIKTKGNTDIIDITNEIQKIIEKEKISEGSVLIFVQGSTASLTTIEFETGLIKDIKEFFEKIIPENKGYAHNEKWHDFNGHSHLRSSLLKTSLTIPFKDKRLLLGTWQQIVLIDFDEKPRKREVILKIMEVQLQ